MRRIRIWGEISSYLPCVGRHLTQSDTTRRTRWNHECPATHMLAESLKDQPNSTTLGSLAEHENLPWCKSSWLQKWLRAGSNPSTRTSKPKNPAGRNRSTKTLWRIGAVAIERYHRLACLLIPAPRSCTLVFIVAFSAYGCLVRTLLCMCA